MTSNGRPIIGITSYAQPARWGAWELPAALVPLYYVDSVEQAGGRALVVPPSEDAVEETLDVLDGIVFSGGIDIDPRATAPSGTRATDPAQAHRDAGELRLLEAALERDLPTLAICRGFQLLNVLRGGDLIQHLPEEVGHEGHRETLGVFSEHPVDVREGTRLETILGPRHEAVRSSHHQGVGRVGDGSRRERVRRGRLARGVRGSVQAVRARRALAPRDGGGRQAALRGSRRRGPLHIGQPGERRGYPLRGLVQELGLVRVSKRAAHFASLNLESTLRVEDDGGGAPSNGGLRHQRLVTRAAGACGTSDPGRGLERLGCSAALDSRVAHAERGIRYSS